MRNSQTQFILLLLSIALPAVCFVGCRTSCQDCISRSQLPYKLNDEGTNYYLTDHLSIDQMMEAQESEDSIQKFWIENLRKKFPNDKELMAYLDLHEKRLEEIHEKAESKHESYWDHLWDVKDNLEKTGGELYYYEAIGKKGKMTNGKSGFEVQEGWLILSRGKIFKTYDAGSGFVSEDLLRTQGIKF